MREETISNLKPIVEGIFKFLMENKEEVFKLVSNIVNIISKLFDIYTSEDSDVDLGAKASIFEENMEEFDSTEEYIKTVEKQEINKENIDIAEEPSFSAMGLALKVANICEKLEITPGFLLGLAKLNIKDTSIIEDMIQTARENLYDPDIEAFLDDKLSNKENDKVYDFLENCLEKVGKSLSDILKEEKSNEE